jgi:hypothetical protein
MQRYRAAELLARKYRGGRGCLYTVIMIGAVWVSMGLCIFSRLFTGNTASGGIFSGMSTGLIIGLAVGIGLIWYLSRGNQAAASAKKTVDEVKTKVDIEEFNALDKEFGGDHQRVVMLQRQAEATVNAFFGYEDTPSAPPALLSVPNVIDAAQSPATPTPPSVVAVPAAQASAARTTIYCTKCGVANAVGSKFCMKCGQTLIT